MSRLHKSARSDALHDIFANGGEMGQLMSTIDWSRTPLGPIESWPQSLRTALSICLTSRFPILIWWGRDLVKLYNDAYRSILATKHPKAMGQRGQECWPEIWDVIGPMLEGVLNEGKSTWSDDQLLLLDRNGYIEECYFTFSYSPIRDETGGVGGVFTAVTETTGHVLGERRLRTLRELAAISTEAETTEEACQAAIEILSRNSADIPFALLYLLSKDGKQAMLQDYTGLPPNTLASPSVVDIDLQKWRESGAESWPFAQVKELGKAEFVDDIATRFGPLSGDFGSITPHSALVLPITRSGQEGLYGFIVAGVSPRLALDEEYRGFFELIAGRVATNIAHIRAYQEERERAEALAELDRAKTTFFSNVSHEFRTPLTLLLSPIDDLLQTEGHTLSPSQRERLEVVYRNGLRLLKLVNTLLDFSRIESGRIQAIYEPTDLSVFTTELANAFREVIERAGIELKVECEPLPEPIYVDREMWEKIILNLLSNAFKFTFEGQIAVRLHCVDDHVELTVQDTGLGIAEEELPHIFERFHRIRGKRARTFEGSGIGLALVQELIRLHGGTISVASTPGQGSTFTVSIPSGSAHLPADRIATTHTATPAPAGVTPYVEEALRWLPDTSEAITAETTELLSQITPTQETQETAVEATAPLTSHILLVEDNADMRHYLKGLLSQYYTVETVSNGRAALEAAKQRIPDLVLSDVMMPELDGFQLLHALREDPQTLAVPVILLSARAGPESTIEGLKAGADDYLVKPFSARELLARIRARLEVSHMRADIIKRERQQAQRLQHLTQESIQARNEFISMISHDLKNPLGAIKGYAQLLGRMFRRLELEPTTADRIASSLSGIDATVQRMTMLVNELLDLAHLQAGKPIQLSYQSADLMAIIQQVLAEQQQTSRKHHLRIETTLEELRGSFDITRMGRVISNLISNAIKYSPKESEITIRVTQEAASEQSGPQAIIVVQDHGIGIPAQDLPHVFEQFRRGKNVAGKIPGTGLGLASVKHILERHGGTVSVTSKEGEGSTFTIRLPLKMRNDLTTMP